ncbi:MAG TPA: aspartate/glutamate racemase family protein [Amaricoccus sp.]|uniref:glutamate racemase n=1 Tax=Amaricoccus sp. TaxID=1872485 RepID=UPI002BB1B19B|nr:aspartate/glutamate racemase family protein [Amaricoccus sp.]HPG21253.1 aspartate/glutamate racemase family protein [Amaricoccus sp.]HRW14052.1 aspartate/glutamate racemase family protein [Amaricoccus sp.]
MRDLELPSAGMEPDACPCGPIGVFDSGLGGLTVLEAFRRRLPEQDFIYFGDNAHAPYGVKSPGEVYRLTVAGVQRLFDEGCRLVILACNTASAVALHDLQVDWLDAAQHRVLGVFVPIIEHLTRRDWGDNSVPTHTGLHDVALFATPATVISGAFPRELRFRARDVTVVPQACAGLVEAIEAGDMDAAAGLVESHVAQLLARLPRPQSAVLGCTHYPLVESHFRAALPPETTLVSQPELTAASLADYLDRHRRFRGGSGQVRYLTSGDPGAIGERAEIFTGHPLPFHGI